ncbi:hypothetical protein JCM19379_21090 [Methyloparacoccus murrellii]|jgi:hypothetical protein
MKKIFYILVVINLLFLGWKFGLEQRDTLIRELNDQHVAISEETLAAPSSLPASGEFEVLPPPGDAAPAGDGSRTDAGILPGGASPKGCFEIGPVQDRETAENHLALLKPTADAAQVIVRAGDVPDGWWVIYPKAGTLEAARANRQMLQNQGIHETWLFDRGPLEGAISLGLYKTREEAIKEQQLLMEKAVPANVVPRLVRGDVFWLRIPWTRLPLELDEAVQTLNSQDPTLAMPGPVSCP